MRSFIMTVSLFFFFAASAMAADVPDAMMEPAPAATAMEPSADMEATSMETNNLRARDLGVSGTSNKESCMYYYYKRTGCAKRFLGICVSDRYGKSS